MPEPPPAMMRLLWSAWTLLRRGRILWLGAAVFLLMSLLAPKEFPTWENLANIVRATSTDALAAAGFTVVMLCGQLDLSIGMTMTSGGVVAMFAQPVAGWTGAILAAILMGGLVGLCNGFLVAKARINSFIVTLGTLTILQGVNRAWLQGGSKSLNDVAAGMQAVNWLQPVLPWSPRVLLIFLPILLLEWALLRSRPGRNLYLIGGNPRTAWLAGIRTDAYVLGAFVLSGVLSALGGAFTAISQNTAMLNLGGKSLMLIIAAVIVGGASMSGGKGSVILSILALAILNALTNGLSYLGVSKSVKLIANGAVLAAVIVLDAWRTAGKNRARGQRRELLAEWAQKKEATNAGDNAIMPAMQSSDRTFATVCVASVACVAIVAIYALSIRQEPLAPPQDSPTPRAGSAAVASLPPKSDVISLKASDGQPLIWIDTAPLQAPLRPADPAKLSDEDLLRWYDHEYAGWNVNKLPMPPSPGNGPRGKKVVSLQYMDHPYWTGYGNGMKRLAAAYGMDLVIMEAGNDNKVQADQVEQVIRMKPDLVILTPVDSNGVVPMLKRLHDEKLPVIASNLIPVDEGMKYVITWTGPDDWGQFRMLAREFARLMNNEGGYCVVRHIAGASCYLSRTWAAISELKKIAPNMKCLDLQSTDLKTEETKTQVAAWLKKYGAALKGIISADDSKAMVGIVEALKDAGRKDVICVAAGSSWSGMKFIKEGKLHAVTYQSAESDGALPIEIAARWFNGEKINRPVFYLQKHIITAPDVDQFMPAQW